MEENGGRIRQAPIPFEKIERAVFRKARKTRIGKFLGNSIRN